jgi:D-glycero-alpha-D-manno-heptose-7-phosphate kinase
MLIVRSPVRISFGGGGTDLPVYYERFGGAVLSAAINKYFYTVVTKRSDNKIQVISSDLRVIETWDDIARQSNDSTELEIPLAAVKHFGKNFSADIFMASEIPPGTGLGSSASVCVNTLKALSTYLDVPLSRHQLADEAYYIARTVLGKPVGKQDEYAAAFGGLNYISFEPNGNTIVEPVDFEAHQLHTLESRLMLFFTGASHDSWNILKEQEMAIKKTSGRSLDALHQIKEQGLAMRDCLERGDLREFAALLDEAWEAKKKVSSAISNSRIDHLYSVARLAGALGGKITGAGGGGFLLLYCEEEWQDSVRKALFSEGIREMQFGFDTNGAQSIVNDPFIDGDETGGNRWRFVSSTAFRFDPVRP